ncbi:MAG: ATP-binding protein [Desulfocapsaceae bacterium]|nr:ATP-binding protein [Desulfocapsaceae bacterium]
MYFFSAAYGIYIILLLTDWHFPEELLICSVFLAGAIFVYGVIDLARMTIENLHDNAVNLEQRITLRTEELIASNSELETSRQKLYEKNIFLENVLESLTHPFYVIDVNSREIVIYNKAAGFTGKPGKTCHELTHDSSLPCCGSEHPCTIEEIRKTGKPVLLEHLHKDPEGKNIFVEVRGYPIFDKNGKLTQIIEYVQDITDRKKAEERLIQAKLEAERANKAKNDFLANVSHEIRTPMNAILGMTDLALATELTENQRKYLETVKGSSDLLLNLINDILDFSKIEAGHFQLDKRSFTFADIIGSILPAMKHSAEEKGITLSVDASDKLCEEKLIGDDLRVQQVLNNLIGNGIKFTDKGSVSVRCICHEPTEDEVKVECSITDTGIGIEQGFFDEIFESFRQVNTSISRLHGGTGLGLAISKLLAELMGGTIHVESEMGKGSRFTFVCRFMKDRRSQDRSNEGDREEVILAPLKVLVVDDISANRDLVRMMLEQDNHSVDEAASGLEALERLAESAYDVVLMDIQMPILDGLQTTGYIRSLENYDASKLNSLVSPELLEKIALCQGKKHLPLLALTARATSDDREKCFTAGMDGYISKPFRKDEIIHEMSRALHTATEKVQ